MQACITYLRISAYSYPALAVYNAVAFPFSGALSNGLRLDHPCGDLFLEGKVREVEGVSGDLGKD